jgi:hypothetical protein
MDFKCGSGLARESGLTVTDLAWNDMILSFSEKLQAGY